MAMERSQESRFAVLDGWRGISILLILATHLLPLGPKILQINSTTGPMGMALFFTLSGFLITNFLIHKRSVTDFLIRRLARVVPLAWLCMSIALIWVGASSDMWLANFAFYSNWPPMRLPEVLSPFWSLCVEMQFYFGVALIFWAFGVKGLYLILPLCISVTLFRIADGVPIAINTYYRVDEILAGCLVSLAYNNFFGKVGRKVLGVFNPYVLVILLIFASHPEGGYINYMRPYVAALLVGWTLLNQNAMISRSLSTRFLGYIATTSYALYLIHPLLAHSWLGSGELIEKYLKRPLLFVTLFIAAHISTFYFEQKIILWAKVQIKRTKVG
jgi:peptidoglycan/LPS O-acetylase OafA/YrhL